MKVDSIYEFFKVRGDPNFWDIVNSPVLVALITALLALLIRRRVNKLAEQVEDEKETAELRMELAEQEAEAGPIEFVQAQDDHEMGYYGADHYDDAAYVIQQLKTFVDNRVASLSDGRKRRKYETIGKRDYRLRVLALSGDGGLTEPERGHLQHAFEIWRPYQTHRRPTPQEVLSDLRSAAEALGIQE